MSSWCYIINQWKIERRVALLLVLLLAIWSSWYFGLYRPLILDNKTIVDRQAKLQAVSQELTRFQLASSNNFIYQNDVRTVQVQETLQQALTEVPSMSVKTVVNNPQVALPSMAQQFPLMQQWFHLTLQPIVKRMPVTITYMGSYESFLQYLNILHARHAALYFESVDFNMEHYPIATITMKVFTLGV